MRLSLKYSASVTSSITTTLPSAGQMIWLSLMVSNRLGILKKEIINKNRKSVAANRTMASQGMDALKKVKDTRLNNPNIKAVMAIVLYPSL